MNFLPQHYSVGTDERALQAEVARQCKYGIVEIGVLFGETTGLLASCTTVPVWGLDPIIPDSMNPYLIGSFERINENTKNCPNFTLIKDYSYNVVKAWSHKIDYVFIDGSHIYEDVVRDFNDWFPLIESGGFLGIHDSAVNRGGPGYWAGPSKLADSLIFDDRLEYYKTVGALTVFKKK